MVGGAALGCGALAAVAFVAFGARAANRGRARDVAVARGVRRGAMVGCVVGLLGLLQVVDGLTLLTAGFVIAPFLVAEAMLSSRWG